MTDIVHNPAFNRLGKKPPQPDPRDFLLSKYLTTLPRIPAVRNWSEGVTDWGMLGNDVCGDCVPAAVAHTVMEMTNDADGPMVMPTTDQVISFYSTITGEEGAAYNPANGANDDGCVITDALNEWRKNGFLGHKLGAYAKVNLNDPKYMRAAIDLFGAVNIGVQLPITAQWQDTWFVSDPTLQGDAAPGSWGGHSVPLIGYNIEKKNFLCVTWGALKIIKWSFLPTYCDEAWALLSTDWTDGSKVAPSGFDLAQLQADLNNL